nr:hypothetical protein [Lachnospiraceae bacterium]
PVKEGTDWSTSLGESVKSTDMFSGCDALLRLFANKFSSASQNVQVDKTYAKACTIPEQGSPEVPGFFNLE